MQNPFETPGAHRGGGWQNQALTPFGAPPAVAPSEQQMATARRTFARTEIAEYATWALINGLTGLAVCGLPGFVAIYRASRALSLIQQHDIGHEHAGRAKVGGALGAIAIIGWVIGGAIFAYSATR